MDQNSTGAKKIKPITLLAVLIEIAFIAIAIVALVKIIQANSSQESLFQYDVSISGFGQELSNIDEGGAKDIYFSIYDAVWLNKKENSDTNNIKAEIRSGSVEKKLFRKDDIYSAYFIVDIPELQQTYQVRHYYSTAKRHNKVLLTQYKTMVYCPDDSQKKYSGQTCRDRFAGKADEIVNSFDYH